MFWHLISLDSIAGTGADWQKLATSALNTVTSWLQEPEEESTIKRSGQGIS